MLQTIETVRTELLNHPLYGVLSAPHQVRIFMQHHVFAVWDFMSLLKRLQRDLTCISLPWVPSPEPTHARFINEIVLGEETDEDGYGGYASHFEIYLEAMREVGADTGPITRFVNAVRSGCDPVAGLSEVTVPGSVRQFVQHTRELASAGGTHEVCAAFFFGREEIIPEMFQALVHEFERHGRSADRLLYYLRRHIELDGDTHGLLAERLLESFCRGNPIRSREAEQTAIRSLRSRIELWNGVLADIHSAPLRSV